MNDLTVEDRILDTETTGQGVAESREGFVDIALAGYELGRTILHVGQRPEAVVLVLEDPVRVVERLGKDGQGHRLE